MSPPSTHAIAIEPIVRYPRQAEPGKTYLMTIDLRPVFGPGEWPYEMEEYVVYCHIDTQGLFIVENIGEPAVVVHRLGGTYGAAKFHLTAVQHERMGTIWVRLINGWGTPLHEFRSGNIRISHNSEVRSVTGRALSAGKSIVLTS